MRILMVLGLLSYWLTHPAVVQILGRMLALAAGALAHPGGAHATAQAIILVLGSHWH